MIESLLAAKSSTSLTNVALWVIFGLVCLTILAPVALLPAVLVGSLILFTAVFRGGSSRATPVDIPVFLLLLLVPLNLYITPTPAQTYPQIYRLSLGIILFYAVVYASSDSRQLSVLFYLNRFLILGISAYGLFTVDVQIFRDAVPEKLSFVFSLINDSVNANVLAGSLIILLPLTIAEFLVLGSNQHPLLRFLHLLSIGAGVSLLVVSQSRGAWIGFACALIVIVALRWKRLRFVTAAIGVGGVILIMNQGIPRLLEFISISPGLTGLPGRAEIWRNSILLIQDFPVTGVGMGSFPYVIDHLYPILDTMPQSVQHAHNLFIQIAADFGLAGLAAWMGILAVIIIADLRVAISETEQDGRIASAAASGSLGAIAALLVHGIFDSVTWGMVRPAPLVWLIWGIGVSGYILSSREKLTSAE